MSEAFAEPTPSTVTTQPALEPAPDPAPVPETAAAQPTPAPEPMPEPCAPEPTEGGEVEEVEASSLSEVLEKLEIDQEWFNGLKVQAKVNGSAKEVSIREAIDSFEIQEAARDRLNEAKAKSEQAQAEIAAQGQALAQQAAIVGKVLESVEAQIKVDVDGTDWVKLRENDPGEYAARRDEVERRRNELEVMKRDAAADWQKLVDEQRGQALQKLKSEIWPQQAQALASAIPEWSDPTKQKAEQAELVSYLVDRFGYSPTELIADPNRPLEQPGVLDHRLIVMARESMLYRRAQDKASVKTKRVIKVPKVMKPKAASEDPPSAKPADDMVTRLYGKN